MAVTVPFHVRRDTEANILVNKALLLPGEFAYATDTNKLYMKKFQSESLYAVADADAVLESMSQLNSAVADNQEALEEAQDALQEALDGNEERLEVIINRALASLDEKNAAFEVRVGRKIDAKVSLPATFGRVGQIAKSDANGGIIWEDGVPVDTTLAMEGAAADSKAVGDRINQVLQQTNVKFGEVDDLISGLQTESAGYINGYTLSDDFYLQLLHDNEPIGAPIPVGAGGGGGGGGGETVIISDMTLENLSGFLTKNIARGSECKARIRWTSTVDNIPTGDGTMRVYVNGKARNPLGVSQGEVEINLGAISTATTNKIRVVIEDMYGKTASIIYTIINVDATLTSSFNPLYAQGETVQFPYIATADADKTMVFVLDHGTPVTEEIEGSGLQLVKEFTGLTHGNHHLEAWFVCDIDGTEITSDHLEYEFPVILESASAPVITFPDGVPYMASETIEQFGSYSKRYMVYTPQATESSVQIYVGEELIQDISVDRLAKTFDYQFRDYGDKVIRFVSGSVERTISVSVSQSAASIGAVTQDLQLYLNAANRSNGESNPWTWTYDGIQAVMTGFNGRTNGWTQVDDGTVLRVCNGARVEIPFLAFASDIKRTGYTWGCEFAARDVRDYGTTIISQYANDRGIRVTASSASLKPSLSPALSGVFKEDTHHSVYFTVQPSDNTYRIITMYVDGVVAGTRRYDGQLDSFTQTSPAGISIGSDDCTVDIYNIRMYNACLTDRQILGNRIADLQDVDEMLSIYRSADVYDQYGNVDISKTADRPQWVIIGDLPTYKGDKKNITGYFVHPDGARSFTINATAQLDVQGTSSQGYPVKNYKIKLKNGVILPDGTVVPKYSLRPGQIAEDTFCLKADYASCEGYNNVELAIMANDISPYRTPAQKNADGDPNFRQSIDGYPCLVYHMASENAPTVFLGKYNFNHDKGTPETFGYLYHGDGQCWEVLENRNNVALMLDTDLTGTATGGKAKWETAFEGRYPDKCSDITWLQLFVNWVDSCNPDKATGDALESAVTYGGVSYSTDTAQYRLAKFKAQVGDYCEVDSGDFYYMFTWLNLMDDSRCKNMMIAFDGAEAPAYTGIKYKAYFPFYDCDTAWGIDNEGDPRFVLHYDMDDDALDPDDTSSHVFKGWDHALWKCWKAVRLGDAEEMYADLRSSGDLSHASVMSRVRAHLAVWGPAIFNADHVKKYVKPLENEGYTEGIDKMAHGDKDSMTDFFVYNRYRYVDSKILAGDERADMIQLRAYASADLQAATYIKKYINVLYGSTYAREFSAVPGQLYTLPCPSSAVMDNTEVNIYGAGLITKLPNIYLLNLGLFDASKLVKLSELWVGKNGFTNTHLTHLSIGRLTLLKVLGFENTTVLTSVVDASGCTGLEEVYGEGSATPAVILPEGAPIRILKLPAVQALDLRGLDKLITFAVTSYSNIESLRLEHNSSAVDPFAILDQIKTHSTVRIIGFHLEANTAAEITALMDKLDTMRGLDEYSREMDTCKDSVAGTIHIDSLTGAQVAAFNARYPLITILADHTTSYRTYADYDGTPIKTVECHDGVPQEAGPANPTRTSTAQYSYTFVGWSKSMNATVADADALDNVIADRTIYAAYSATTRTYTITWVNSDNTTLETDTNVPYGSTPAYNGATPVNPVSGGGAFQGWTPAVTTVTGNATYKASFIKTYQVRWYNDTELLKTETVNEGGNATPPAETPVKKGVDNPEAWIFTGWSGSYTNVQANTDLTAQFRESAGAPTATTADGAYGVEWAYNNSASALTRKGLAASFADPAPATSVSGSGSSPFDTIAPWKDIAVYNVVNGSLVAKGASGFDMAANDTVVWIPEFYYTAYKDTTNQKWLWAISPTPLTGYVKHPGSGRYVGRYHTGGSSSGVYSKSGVAPLANTSQTNFRSYSKAKGNGWYMLDLATWSAIQMLYLVEFANFDSQTTLGKGWNTGSVGTMGGTDAAVYHTVKATGAHNQYRWIEDPFSNVYDWIDGFLGNKSAIYVGTDNAAFNDQTSALKKAGSLKLPSSGYISGFGYSEESAWAFIPDTASGSDSTYVRDYVGSNSSSYPAYVGGRYSDSANCGFFYFYAGNSATYTNAYLGSRLLYAL